MYFAVAPQRHDVLNKLDTAMKRITIMNPDFVSKITKQYLEDGAGSLPAFSRSKQEFIDAQGTIRVAMMRHAAPFSYMEGNELQGILPELCSRISDLTGLNFTLIPVDSQAEAIRLVKSGQADVVGRMADNAFFALKYNLRLTTPYADISMVQMTLKLTEQVKTVAVQGDSQLDFLKANEPAGVSHEFSIYPDVEQCFEALSSGKVDAFYCDSITALYLMNTHRVSEFKVNGLPGYPYNLTFGVCHNVDPRLTTILDKCIRHISANGLDGMIARDRMPKTMTFGAAIDRMPGNRVAMIFGFLLLVAFALASASILLWRKRGIEKKMACVRERNHHIQADLHAVKKINEAKDDFFSHISHDMRTPLNGIIGFTNLASQTDDEAKKNEYLDKIRISSNLLLDLVSDTLQLSKLERGKLPFTWETMDSCDFIAHVVTPIQVIADENGVQFQLDMSGVRPEKIRIDRLNTQKIFLNILSNSVKFTPEGGRVSMVAETCAAPDDRYGLKVVISDTGIGISEEFLPRIFEPFAQKHRVGTTKIPGTGLGLSIVRQLVDLLGGTIDITSQPNEGTTVTVVLSFERAGDTGEEPVDGAIMPAHAGTALQGKKLLLSEDNELNMEIAKTLLEAQGMTVDCAVNGQEAIDLFKTSPIHEYAAILMDIRMPVLNGYGAVQAIRKLDRIDAKTIPVLAMTADAYEEDIKHCLDVGMNAHIPKPINPQQLFAELSKWVR